MGLLIQYLSSIRARVLDELINADLDPATFHKSQGMIRNIDDILGLPILLESFKHKDVV